MIGDTTAPRRTASCSMGMARSGCPVRWLATPPVQVARAIAREPRSGGAPRRAQRPSISNDALRRQCGIEQMEVGLDRPHGSRIRGCAAAILAQCAASIAPPDGPDGMRGGKRRGAGHAVIESSPMSSSQRSECRDPPRGRSLRGKRARSTRRPAPALLRRSRGRSRGRGPSGPTYQRLARRWIPRYGLLGSRRRSSDAEHLRQTGGDSGSRRRFDPAGRPVSSTSRQVPQDPGGARSARAPRRRAGPESSSRTELRVRKIERGGFCSREKLVADVVDHEAVIAREGGDGRAYVRQVGQGNAGEVEGGRPSLGVLEEHIELGRAQPRPILSNSSPLSAGVIERSPDSAP